MGADLYINSIYDKKYEEYKPHFDDAVRRRDALQWGTPAYDAVQKEVTHYYDKMNDDESYFRDSYNNSSLFWTLDLSWWNDVIPLLDEENNLPLEEARKLRSEVAQRAEIMERKIIQKETPFDGEDREECITYFREKLVRFLTFLDKSLELGECIHCSL